jgi:RNA polymerase sigma factor (sigma-70 family)
VSRNQNPSVANRDNSQFEDAASFRHLSSAPKLREWPAEELTRIRMVLRKLTALRIENPEDAEDLVQETLLTMIEKCPEIALRKGLLVWGMGILRKKVGNYYRRGQRYSALQRENLNAVMLHPTQAPPSAESTIHYRELRSLVETIVKKFPPHERVVMDLLVSGLATREIVKALYPERYQNIVNRVHRGRKRLHKELAKHGYMNYRIKKVRK